MFSTSFLHKIIYRFGVWITPIALIIISIFINLPNADLHKQTLRSSNFYASLSSEIQDQEINTQDINRGFSSLLFKAVLQELATPGWLQSFFEQNIDLFAEWLTNPDPNSDLVLYIPSQEIELAVNNQLNQVVATANEKFKEQIPACNKNQEERIKREGFSFETNFCLPEKVKNKEQTLLQFLEIGQEDLNKTRVLDKVINNNILTNFNENFKAKDVLSLNPLQRSFLDFLNQIRNLFLWLKTLFLPLLILILILFIADLLLAKFMDNKKINYEIRRYFYTIAIGTLSSSILIILIFGGFVYLNGWIQSIFIPGLDSSTITNLLALESLKFTFNLVSFAIWISLGMIVFNLVYKLLETTGILSDVHKKNQKLQMATSSITKNPTLDGEFQRIRQMQNPQTIETLKQNFEEIEKNQGENLFQNSGSKIKMTNDDVQSQRLEEFENKYQNKNDFLD